MFHTVQAVFQLTDIGNLLSLGYTDLQEILGRMNVIKLDLFPQGICRSDFKVVVRMGWLAPAYLTR